MCLDDCPGLTARWNSQGLGFFGRGDTHQESTPALVNSGDDLSGDLMLVRTPSCLQIFVPPVNNKLSEANVAAVLR